MSEHMFALVEAERVWCQQWARGLEPDIEGNWLYVKHPKITGRVVAAPPQDRRLAFKRVRTATEGERPGLIGLGANVPLIQGHYRVTYWLVARPQNQPPQAELVTAAVESNRRKVALRVITAAEAQASRQPMGITLEIDIAQSTTPVDFVTWWQGRGEVSFLRTECMLLR